MLQVRLADVEFKPNYVRGVLHLVKWILSVPADNPAAPVLVSVLREEIEKEIK